MEIRPKDYYEAAHERLSQAERLFDLSSEYLKNRQGERYAVIVYLASVAVECMLRAYRLKESKQFDSRHKLADLFLESKMRVRLEEWLNHKGEEAGIVNEQLRELKAAVNEADRLWRNDYRYASEKLLFQDFLKRGIIAGKGTKGSKAQILRQHAKRLLGRARLVIEAGAKAWT